MTTVYSFVKYQNTSNEYVKTIRTFSSMKKALSFSKEFFHKKGYKNVSFNEEGNFCMETENKTLTNDWFTIKTLSVD